MFLNSSPVTFCHALADTFSAPFRRDIFLNDSLYLCLFVSPLSFCLSACIYVRHTVTRRPIASHLSAFSAVLQSLQLARPSVMCVRLFVY